MGQRTHLANGPKPKCLNRYSSANTIAIISVCVNNCTTRGNIHKPAAPSLVNLPASHSRPCGQAARDARAEGADIPTKAR